MRKAVADVVANFPHGSLALICWVTSATHYDPRDRGTELDAPEVAIMLEPLPDDAFQSYQGKWVVPFKCMFRGDVCITTTFSCTKVEAVDA